MRMHPEGSTESQREVVVGASARRNRRPGDAGYTVLLPWRREAVPVDQARLVDPIFEAHAESLPDLCSDPEGAVGLPDTEHRGRSAVHLDVAAFDPQHGRWGAIWPRLRARKGGDSRSRHSGK